MYVHICLYEQIAVNEFIEEKSHFFPQHYKSMSPHSFLPVNNNNNNSSSSGSSSNGTIGSSTGTTSSSVSTTSKRKPAGDPKSELPELKGATTETSLKDASPLMHSSLKAEQGSIL
jgi:hypothetical protein